jgi:hypothetical protein
MFHFRHIVTAGHHARGAGHVTSLLTTTIYDFKQGTLPYSPLLRCESLSVITSWLSRLQEVPEDKVDKGATLGAPGAMLKALS